MTQWERAVDAAAKVITQTEAERPGATAGELAAAALRAALPALFEARDDLVGDHHWWRLSLEEHRRALEAEASHD